MLLVYRRQEAKPLFVGLISRFSGQDQVLRCAWKGFNLHEEVKRVIRDWYRERMYRIYLVYNRAKLGDIERILDEFQGQEELVIQNMVQKYGVEPSDAQVNSVSNVANGPNGKARRNTYSSMSEDDCDVELVDV